MSHKPHVASSSLQLNYPQLSHRFRYQGVPLYNIPGQNSAVSSTVQDSTVQGTFQCSVLFSEVQGSRVQCIAVQHSTKERVPYPQHDTCFSCGLVLGVACLLSQTFPGSPEISSTDQQPHPRGSQYTTHLREVSRHPSGLPRATPKLKNIEGSSFRVLEPTVCPSKISRKCSPCPLAAISREEYSGRVFDTACLWQDQTVFDKDTDCL